MVRFEFGPAATNANRSLTPWIIATGHRPFYCSNGGWLQCGLFSDILRSQAEDLLVSNHVDLVITGHQHNMESTYPVYNNTAVANNYASPKGTKRAACTCRGARGRVMHM